MIGDGRLDESSYLIYAARHYTAAASSTTVEFYEDLGRVKNINRLIRRYSRTAVLSERLILNHLVALYNVFEPAALSRMLIYKLYPYLDILKPFLVYLNYWPDVVHGIGALAERIDCAAIESDPLVEEQLKSL